MRLIPLVILMLVAGCGTSTQRMRTEIKRGTDNGHTVDLVTQTQESENMTVIAPNLGPVLGAVSAAAGGAAIPWDTIIQGGTAALLGGGVMYARKLAKHEDRKAKERGVKA